jgi:hypothetical protein
MILRLERAAAQSVFLFCADFTDKRVTKLPPPGRKKVPYKYLPLPGKAAFDQQDGANSLKPVPGESGCLQDL